MAVIIDGYTIDAAIEESIKMVSDVTEYPVEDGASITDHVRNRPLEVTITGVVSDYPLRPLADERGPIFTTLPIDKLPSEEFLTNLELIHQFREPIQIETTRRIYDNMILQDLDVPTDARTGEALRFRARFRQIELITNDRTEINVTLARAKKRKSLGARSPLQTPSQAPSPPKATTDILPGGSGTSSGLAPVS